MAKNSNETVFSLTLTEVVIILFFTVILLFALKDIPPEADCPLDDPKCVVGGPDKDEVCVLGIGCFDRCLKVTKEINPREYLYLYNISVDQTNYLVRLGDDHPNVRSELDSMPSSARELLEGSHSEIAFRNLSKSILEYTTKQKDKEEQCLYYVKSEFSDKTTASQWNRGSKTIDEFYVSLKPN